MVKYITTLFNTFYSIFMLLNPRITGIPLINLSYNSVSYCAS